MQPLRNVVLIKPEEKASRTKSGIFIETKESTPPTLGTVWKTGPDCAEVKEGDKVLFKEYGLDKIEIGEETYLVGDEEDIVAIIND